ncbi:hypothetical protein AVEN_184677-1 [Araneus ventricosus]|uniref:Uncharacterized protein n=1 Tax=Araneus ventricosus TaxID=182803 RepID=A0A4Y2FSI4_ARAVE|nr:hypothetical protein AVEN_184677-1 [Araneus ventricosus]
MSLDTAQLIADQVFLEFTLQLLDLGISARNLLSKASWWMGRGVGRKSRRCESHSGSKFGLFTIVCETLQSSNGIEKGVCSRPQTNICRFLLINRPD